MDEASATAAVDLVRRPHAEISLAFTGERVGGLALSLLPHALERFAMQAGLHRSRHRRRLGRPSRRRGGVSRRSAGRCGRRAHPRRRRRPVDEGTRVKVVLADYGAGNLRSVCSALARAGAGAGRRPGDPAEVAARRWRSSPGSATLARAAAGLGPLADVLRERVAAGRPVFGICVGLQLLFEQSEEGGEGLELLAGRVRKRPRATRAAHGLERARGHAALALLDGLDGADVYFAHSYAVQPDDEDARRRPGRPRRRGRRARSRTASLAGVQFHPERSGAAGARAARERAAVVRSA